MIHAIGSPELNSGPNKAVVPASETPAGPLAGPAIFMGKY